MSDNIKKSEDGKYRWVYELNMLKTPVILITVLKVLLIAFGAVWLFTTLLSLGNRDFFWKGFILNTRNFAILTALFLVLGCIAYLIVAAVYGGKYCVLFEMDEKSIRHEQMAKQVKKAEVLAMLTVVTGIAAKSPGTVGTGLLAASRTVMVSEFSKARKIKAYPRQGLIKVNTLLEHNQIYVEKEDFDFVLSYITERADRAK